MNTGGAPWAGAAWRKSSHSAPERDCVEVAGSTDVVGVRDCKQGEDSPVLVFDRDLWRDFLVALRSG